MNPDGSISRYPFKFSSFSSHAQILKMLGRGKNSRLLDLGSGDGTLSSAIQNIGWDVTGLELDPYDTDLARAKGLNVVSGNVSDISELFHAERFDVVLAADILEHLSDPEKVLLNLVSLFRDKDSFAVVSIPNIANIVIRLQLLMGQFNYTDRGILDRTHLRFFTKKSLLQMIDQSSCLILEIRYTSIPVEFLFGKYGQSKIVKFLQLLSYSLAKVLPKLFAYQFVLKVKKIGS